MERLGKRLGILCAIVLTTGATLTFAPRPKQVERTEADVAAMLPLKVKRYNAELATGQYCTYKLDQSNYDILNPWGIVARVFSNGPDKFEVVAIASRRKESFHDPQTCLTAQGWTLSNQRVTSVQTQARGVVPVTLFDMERPGEKLTAMYFLKVTQGYYAEIGKLKLDMFKYKVMNLGKDDEGAFIRIIPAGRSDEAKMKQFAADWIDEAVKTSKDYY
jgi:Protein of unknown function (DUF3485)